MSDNIWESLENVDWDLLYEQKSELVKLWFKKSPNVDIEKITGLLNFLDFLMDEAEEKGLFIYPKQNDDEDI